jgi:hypothetical protein
MGWDLIIIFYEIDNKNLNKFDSLVPPFEHKIDTENSMLSEI